MENMRVIDMKNMRHIDMENTRHIDMENTNSKYVPIVTMRMAVHCNDF